MRAAPFTCLLAMLLPAVVFAGAGAGNEVMVTAASPAPRGYGGVNANFRSPSFAPGPSNEAGIPVIGLRRVADFAVQAVVVTDDTRDPARRHDEIFSMVRAAIELAAKRGTIELATGEMVIEPLTLANYRDLTLTGDQRPDTDMTRILVKTRLAKGVDAKEALDRIDAFIKAVPTVGRSEMKRDGDLTLSVVSPDQYRGAIIDLVAADARATAARLGPDYAAEATGLDRPVQWSRASLTEVFLYVPYSYTVVPKTR